MAAQIMDGSTVAAILERIRTVVVADLFAETGRRPVLATVLVGDGPASHTPCG